MTPALPIAFLPTLQGWEIIAILAAALLIFGPTKLPQLSKAVGKAIKNFRKETGKEDKDEEGDGSEESEKSGEEKRPGELAGRADETAVPKAKARAKESVARSRDD